MTHQDSGLKLNRLCPAIVAETCRVLLVNNRTPIVLKYIHSGSLKSVVNMLYEIAAMLVASSRNLLSKVLSAALPFSAQTSIHLAFRTTRRRCSRRVTRAAPTWPSCSCLTARNSPYSRSVRSWSIKNNFGHLAPLKVSVGDEFAVRRSFVNRSRKKNSHSKLLR